MQAQLQEQLSKGEEAQANQDEANFAQLQSEKVLMVTMMMMMAVMMMMVVIIMMMVLVVVMGMLMSTSRFFRHHSDPSIMYNGVHASETKPCHQSVL